MLRRRRVWLIGLVLVPAALWVCDRIGMIIWDGVADVEIIFMVSDADTGQAVGSATIDVNSRGGCYGEPHDQAFMLVADDMGVARKRCQCMCSGRRSGLRLTDTFGVTLPQWDVSVAAQGYRPIEWIEIKAPDWFREWQPEGRHGGKPSCVFRCNGRASDEIAAGRTNR